MPCGISIHKERSAILEESYPKDLDRHREKALIVSHYKYGSARKNFSEGRVDAIKTAELCIEAYKKDGNKEHIVDAMNYLGFEWKFPIHPKAHFKSTDSSVGVVGTPINMEK